VVIPGVRTKQLETITQTALSVGRLVTHRIPDAVLMFNAANSMFLPALRARRIPVATHVDGLEWQRAKWSGAGQRYYRRAEGWAVRWSDALIADAQGIADYYREEFDAPTELIAYGAQILSHPASERIGELGLRPRGYHLVVARFEPENHVHMIISGYRQANSGLDLVVVGAAPYQPGYTAQVADLAAGDPRIRMVGSVWDQELLDALYANAMTYIHGHSVGGTNPSLLRAMGAAAPVLAFDVGFNREVVGPAVRVFAGPAELAAQITLAESDAEATLAYGRAGQRVVASRYRWDDVADRYADLVQRLAAGYSIHGPQRRRRIQAPAAAGPAPDALPGTPEPASPVGG
jgi:glycosyltransferase involved in cell wall biosynthesis